MAKKKKTTGKKTFKKKGRSPTERSERRSPPHSTTHQLADDDSFWDNQARKIQGGSSTFRREIWKPQQGTNRVRLFMSASDEGSLLAIRNDTHWYEGAEGRRPILCIGGAPFPRQASCAICQAQSRFPEDVWQGTKQQSGLRANTTYLVNIWPYTEEELKIGQLAQSIMDGRKRLAKPGLLEVVKTAGVYNPLDIKRGRDFTIKRTGTSWDTIYDVSIARKPTVFKPKIELFDLFEFITIPTEEEVEEVCEMLLEKYASKR